MIPKLTFMIVGGQCLRLPEDSWYKKDEIQGQELQKYVPVIVLDWPAANIPIAQIYIAADPNWQPR